MTKKATLTTISTGYNSLATINANLEAINDKLDNTVSRDGSTPNTMSADFDLNNNDLLNVNVANITSLKLNGVTATALSATPDWKGAWVTATAYVKDDLVQESGNTYICLVAHTSGTFSTDLAAVKWELFASKGASGAGSGDLVSTNNLSDVSNADTSLTNLGGGTTGIAVFKGANAAAVKTTLGLTIGTDVQAYDANLTALASVTSAANKVPYFTGSGTASVLDFKDEDSFASDSASAVASQQSIKAYVDAQVAAVNSLSFPTDGTGEVVFNGTPFNSFSGSASAYLATNYVYAIPLDLTKDLDQAVTKILHQQASNSVASSPTCRLAIYERTGTFTLGNRLAYTNSFTWTNAGGWTSSDRSLVSSWTPVAGSYWITLQVGSDDVRGSRLTYQPIAVTTQSSGSAPVEYYMLRSTAAPSGWSVGSAPPSSGASTTFSAFAGNAPGFALKT